MNTAHRIEVWPLDRLQPYARNARTHSEEQIAKIAASIAEFGFTNPILVDSDAGIIAGHGRLAAARALGLTAVPVIPLEHLSERQRRAYILADNRLALDAGWDEALLAEELAALQDEDFDLALTGFSDKELADLLVTEETAGPAEMPNLPTGDKGEFQKRTFTLHDDQANVVDDALILARTKPEADTGVNENSNGNALALICYEYLRANNAHR